MANNINIFGGFWTDQKVDIFLKYVKAYLDIMAKYNFKIIYFDGFAGSGKREVETESGVSLLESVCLSVLALDHRKQFDMYYFVELDVKKYINLKNLTKNEFPLKQIHVVNDDCNARLVGLSDFLRTKRSYRALAFIDPYGMSVHWSSLQSCKKLGIDMWILVPTGIDVNRHLTRSAEIDEPGMKRLENFLGMGREDIYSYFYKRSTEQTLFGMMENVSKIDDATQHIADLYASRLKDIWNFVSEPFPMKNSTGAVLFHFICASQNKTAQKIANEIIGKQLSNQT